MAPKPTLTTVRLSNFAEHNKLNRNITGTGTEGISKGTTIIGLDSERMNVLRDVQKLK